MDDLVAWLRAQLDEDERVVRRNTDGRGLDGGYPQYPTFVDDDTAAADAYLAQFGPARMLREVDAKRRLLTQFELRGNSVRATVQPSTGGVWDDLLRMLALPYADRPGYRDEWRP